MKSKFDTILKNILKENLQPTSIRTLLYQLHEDLEPSAKTKNGERVSDRLKGILDEFNQIVDKAKNNVDQPETLQALLRDLALA